MVQYPSNSFHYAGIGKQSVEGTGVAPTPMIKYQEFTGNAQIEVESDEGHIGARGKGTVNSRTKAFAEPEFKDRIRWDAGIEHIIYAFCGGVSSVQNGATTAYTHTYSWADSLPFYSITQGYNVSSETAKRFVGAVANNLEFSFPTEESPTVTVGWVSNFPTFGVAEPTLTYSTTQPAKTGELTFKMGSVGGALGSALSNYTEGSCKLSNNIEATVDAGNAFGSVNKDMGDLTCEGSFTLKYTQDEQRIWATGAIGSTAVTTANYSQGLQWIYTGAALAGVGYNYKFQLDVYNAEITKVTPTEGGDGAKSFEFEYTGMANSSNKIADFVIVSKITAIS